MHDERLEEDTPLHRDSNLCLWTLKSLPFQLNPPSLARKKARVCVHAALGAWCTRNVRLLARRFDLFLLDSFIKEIAGAAYSAGPHFKSSTNLSLEDFSSRGSGA